MKIHENFKCIFLKTSFFHIGPSCTKVQNYQDIFLWTIFWLSADDDYMKMKIESFKKAHQPVRSVQQLDRVVQNYKPRAHHKHLVSKSKLACILSLWFVLHFNNFYRKNMRIRRKLKENDCEMTRMLFWICFLKRSININTIVSQIWCLLRNNHRLVFY